MPDGLIPLWWCAVFYAMAAIPVGLGALRTRSEGRKTILVGLLASLSFVFMQVPIGHAHVNLTGLIGILLGPWSSAVAVFIVNLACALMGHGGITIVGLNTLINWGEAAGVWGFYRLLRKRLNYGAAAGIATFSVLATSSVIPSFVIAWVTDKPVLPFILTLTTAWIVTAVIEAVITASVVKTLAQMKPDWVRDL
ncbi:energy-coupling factor ABC transporter permease [Methanopyrus sp.]